MPVVPLCPSLPPLVQDPVCPLKDHLVLGGGGLAFFLLWLVGVSGLVYSDLF